ncbi:VTT domain-containing protein [Paenibacillus sp. BK720]|uniref:VTT domain-containing protein n=1 Tax=Paenibacillus sp. BK720 TaxID=2587092 RepID=UPI00142242CF|nr:VTT domain-containing protein [Paenibacillus sp. BK720]
MLALPLPGEIMMSYAGMLVFEKKLSWLLSILTASAGVTAGITLSYWIGYWLGKPFIAKYGHRFHMGAEQMERLTVWFEKYGDKLLFIAYFIPGIRHITGYFCGVTRMPFRRYAIYAYSGAVFWVSLFISLGKVLGPKWETYHSTVNRYLIIFAIASGLLFLLYNLMKKYKYRIIAFLLDLVSGGVRQVQSLGKAKYAILASFAVFLLLLSVMFGMIQDFVAKEFGQFDEVIYYLVLMIIGSRWHDRMEDFLQIGSIYLHASVIALTFVVIRFKGNNKLLELLFLCWTTAGGVVLNEGLRMVFHRTGPVSSEYGFPIMNTFPSEDTFTAVTVMGFCVFLILRHYSQAIIHLFMIAAAFLLCLLLGISLIYFHLQYPSDVAAGYVFGGVWVSLNVFMLEVRRKLQRSRVSIA